MIARRWMWMVLACTGCSGGRPINYHAPTTPDAGGDPAATAQCLSCHTKVKADWQNPSSHSVLLSCTTCHALMSDTPGPLHALTPYCSDCHSEGPHPFGASSCTACHNPHGSRNAFLIKTHVTLPGGSNSAPVHFTKPEGDTPDGLAHSGKGLCEVCHTATKYYLGDGQGAPHDTEHCTGCHDHQAGFASP